MANYISTQAVTALVTTAAYGLGVPDGMDPRIEMKTYYLSGFGDTPQEANDKLTKVIQGHCETRICIQFGTRETGLTLGTKILKWFADRLS